jgi:hypothetical protein
MIDIFNPDFKDLIRSLNKFDVQYLLVGGYAVIIHGYSRSTADLDIWINRTEENYYLLMKAFFDFGLPGQEVNKNSFLHDKEIEVYRFGIEPSALDLIIGMKAIPFENAFQNSIWKEIGHDLRVRVVNLPDLKKLKLFAGRANDLNDLENLPPDPS